MELKLESLELQMSQSQYELETLRRNGDTAEHKLLSTIAHTVTGEMAKHTYVPPAPAEPEPVELDLGDSADVSSRGQEPWSFAPHLKRERSSPFGAR